MKRHRHPSATALIYSQLLPTPSPEVLIYRQLSQTLRFLSTYLQSIIDTPRPPPPPPPVPSSAAIYSYHRAPLSPALIYSQLSQTPTVNCHRPLFPSTRVNCHRPPLPSTYLQSTVTDPLYPAPIYSQLSQTPLFPAFI